MTDCTSYFNADVEVELEVDSEGYRLASYVIVEAHFPVWSELTRVGILGEPTRLAPMCLQQRQRGFKDISPSTREYRRSARTMPNLLSAMQTTPCSGGSIHRGVI